MYRYRPVSKRYGLREMEKYIEKLGPPTNMDGFHQVRENLIRISEDFEIDERMQLLMREIDELIGTERRGSSWNSNYQVSAESRFYGGIGDHPIWIALYVDNRCSRQIQGLQRILIAAALNDSISEKLKNHDFCSFGLIIRKIGRQSSMDSEEIRTDYSALISENDRLNLLRFTRVVSEQKVVRREREGRTSVSSECLRREGVSVDYQGKMIMLVPEDPDDPVNSPGVAQYLPNVQSTVPGIEPAEDHQTDQILILIEHLKRLSVEMRIGRERSEAARGILAGVIAAPTISRRQLTDEEIFRFLNLIDDLDIYEYGNSEWMLGKILKLMLFTSSSFEEVCLIGSDVDVPIRYAVRNNSFYIRRIRPDYRTNRVGVLNAYTDNSINNRDYVELPNVVVPAKDMKVILETLPLSDIYVLKEKAKNLLKEVIPRVTLGMISRQAYEISKSAYDPVIVQITYGIRVPSASTQQYYTAVSESQVLECYSYSVNEILKRAGRNILDFTIMNRGYYSCKNVITDCELKSLIISVRSELVSAPRWSNQRHNLETLFCIIVQAIFTTVRGVYDPLIEINHNEAVYFRDKDGPDFSHARFQFCHSMARKISDYYKIQRKYALGYLVGQTESNDFCFFLDSDWKMIEPSHAIVNQYLSKYCKFLLNSIRKYIRSKMVEMNYSYDAINLVLNHHSSGEALWDKYSTVDPIFIRREIIEFYDVIIDELGIREDWFHVDY